MMIQQQQQQQQKIFFLNYIMKASIYSLPDERFLMYFWCYQIQIRQGFIFIRCTCFLIIFCWSFLFSKFFFYFFFFTFNEKCSSQFFNLFDEKDIPSSLLRKLCGTVKKTFERKTHKTRKKKLSNKIQPQNISK